MANQEEMKKAIMASCYETVSDAKKLHKCNFCKKLDEDSGMCTHYKKEVPADFCGTINNCKHWSVIVFDDPIPF